MGYRDELAAAQARANALAAERDALVRERDALIRERDGKSPVRERRLEPVRATLATKEEVRKPKRRVPSDPYVEPFMTAVGMVMGILVLFGIFLSLPAC